MFKQFRFQQNLRCEELGVVLASYLPLEVLGREVELVALGCLLVQLIGLLLEQLERILLGNSLAFGGLDTMPCPLPELRPRHFSSSSILHEVVDRHTADTTNPSLHIAETNVEVLADTSLGDLAGDIHVQQVVGGDMNILATDVHLVGCRHVLVEDVRGDLGKCRVCDPCTVVASADLTELVGLDLSHGGIVGLLIILDRNLSSHTTHGMNASSVAGLDEELDVSVHEGRCHRDGIAVRKNEVGILTEPLNRVENVVPATTVQAGGVIAELVDDLPGLAIG